MALLISALLFFAAFLLLLSHLAHQRRRERQVSRRLQGQMSADNTVGSWLQRLGRSQLGQRSINLDSETRVLLNRIGWRSTRQRALFAACQVGFPLCVLGVVGMTQSLAFPDPQQPWLVPLCASGLGYLLPKRVLAMAAAYRQQAVAKEVSTFIALLRILFESGLAVEQSLRILSTEAHQLLPILTKELRVVLVRVDSGLELADELDKTAKLLEVDEFTDTCVILEQLIVQGGGAMKSLLSLKQLLDDRRLTRMQEKISKLSGKMSGVMMVFLFPALMIVLAGPALTALAKAFAS